MRRHAPRLLVGAILVVVAGCSGSGPGQAAQQPTPTPPPVVEQLTPAAAARAAAKVVDLKTAVSARFKLAAGTYQVTYSSSAPAGGCAFSLLLEPKAGGTIVESTISLPDVSGQEGPFSGSDTWSNVPAGTYVLEEDRSGLENCTGAWSATLTPSE